MEPVAFCHFPIYWYGSKLVRCADMSYLFVYIFVYESCFSNSIVCHANRKGLKWLVFGMPSDIIICLSLNVFIIANAAAHETKVICHHDVISITWFSFETANSENGTYVNREIIFRWTWLILFLWAKTRFGSCEHGHWMAIVFDFHGTFNQTIPKLREPLWKINLHNSMLV